MRPRRALRLAVLTALVTTLATFVLLNNSVHGGVRKQRRKVSSWGGGGIGVNVWPPWHVSISVEGPEGVIG